MDLKYDFTFLKTPDQITERVTGGNKGLLFLANEMRRQMDPYVPANDMMLSQNVRTYVDGQYGIVEYNSPYAHYQYTGKVYIDPKTKAAGFWIEGVGFRSRKGINKIPTNRKLEYLKFRHPNATDHWDEAMLKARKKDLETAMQNFIDRGAK